MAVYNVLNFGAVGDNVADDSDAIQDAIDACVNVPNTSQNVGIVYIPAGRYKISRAMIVSGKTGCIIRGDGAGATFICNSTRTKSAFYFENCGGSGVEELQIEKWSGQTAKPTEGWGIDMWRCSNMRLSGIYIGGCYSGINIAGSTGTLLDWVTIRVIYGTYGINYVGTSAVQCFGASLRDVIIDPVPGITSNTSAILLCQDSYAYSLTINHVALLGGGVGFVMRNTVGGVSARPQFVQAFDLECDHNQVAGIQLFGGIGFYMVSSWIGSCIAGNGIHIGADFAGSVTIDSSRIAGNYQTGILVYGGPKDVIINACIVSGNGVQTPNTFAGIGFASNATDFIVTACKSGSEAGASGQQSYGIVVNGGCTRYICTSNNLTGNLSGGIFDAGSAPKALANNI